MEDEWIHLGPDGRHILFLKLARQVTLDKGGLAGASVSCTRLLLIFPVALAYEDQFECWHGWVGHSVWMCLSRGGR